VSNPDPRNRPLRLTWIYRAIHHDKSLYPDPDVFKPDRWLSSAYPTYREPLSKFPTLQNFSAFGFGRRICPGMNIAEKSLYLLVARIAWACTISKRPNVDVPWYDYTAGFNTQPKKFSFDLKARLGREVLVEESWLETSMTEVEIERVATRASA